MPEGHAEVGVVSGESQFEFQSIEQGNVDNRANRIQIPSISKVTKTAISSLFRGKKKARFKRPSCP
jgi:hypothetical protein